MTTTLAARQIATREEELGRDYYMKPNYLDRDPGATLTPANGANKLQKGEDRLWRSETLMARKIEVR